MPFGREIIEILEDTEDSAIFDRMADAIEAMPAQERDAIMSTLGEAMRPLRPPMPTFLHDEYDAAIVTAFTYGVIAGREHARRGYPPPRRGH